MSEKIQTLINSWRNYKNDPTEFARLLPDDIHEAHIVEMLNAPLIAKRDFFFKALALGRRYIQDLLIKLLNNKTERVRYSAAQTLNGGVVPWPQQEC